MQLQKQKVLVPNIFQYEALQKLEGTNKNKGVIIMPTGTGKTFLASLWFKKQLETNSKAKLLFICHNKDILSQANEKEFQNCLKELDITYGYYNAYEKNIQQCTFATTQTLTRNLNDFYKDYFDYIIVDEAHHYQAKSFKKVLEYFKPTFLLGLTATPSRMDGKNIYEICGNKLYEAKISDAIKKGLLTKIRYYCVDNDIDFSDVKWNGNKYDEKDLNRKMCVKEYDEAIIKEYNETVKEKFNKTKTICFCATVEHAHRMSKLFNDNNISAIALTGKYHTKKIRVTIHKEKREDIIKNFKKGVYEIIFVRDLFNEGVDIPDADCVMMLRPTQSHTIFTQQIGRGLRTSENKEDVLILDFTGNARKCVINFEVLGEMIDLDIVKKVKSENYKRRNEVIILSNGCEIKLSKKKMDVINNIKFYNKDILIKEYLKAKDKLKKIPNPHEFSKESGIDYHNVIKFYGSWSNFKKSFGDQKKHTKERVIKQLKEFYKKYKKYPTVRDLRRNNMISDNTIRNLFGSFAKAIQECGGIPNQFSKLDLSKGKILKDYKRIKNKLGKVPYCEELEGELPYSFWSAIHQYFGLNYTKFLKKIGDFKEYNKIANVNCLSKEDIIKEYLLHKRKGKDIPSNVKYGIGKYFDSFKKFKEYIGDNSKPYNWVSKEESLRRFNEVKEKIGGVPSTKDMKENGYGISTYVRDYGSWRMFLKSQGLNVKSHSKRIKIGKDWDIYVKEFYRIKNKLGKVPTFKEVCKESKIVIGSWNDSPYRNFGEGYNSFLTKIRENTNFNTYSDEEIIKRFYELKKEKGRVPFITDWKSKSDFFNRRFGGYHIFLKKIGEDKDLGKGKLYATTEADLIKSFFDTKKRLGRFPKADEWNRYGVAQRRYGSYKSFFKKIGINPKEIYGGKNYENCFLTKEDMFREYKRVKELYGKDVGLKQFSYKYKLSTFSEKKIRNTFGKFSIFKNEAEKWLKQKNNIKIISNYKPKTIIIPIKKNRKGLKKTYEGLHKEEYKSKIDKVDIRKRIISKIQDGDNVLLLESPDLSAIKEIERQNKKPNKIIIPNHLEFKKLANAIQSYKTKLNIEIVNTSVLQYLVDSEEKFDFIWLDYCGAFSYYMKDLDILFSKKFNNIKLVLTYNLFDPAKEDENYYFTRVIDYVLSKNETNKIRLINDISYRYKKNMYNLGFNIQEVNNERK